MRSGDAALSCRESPKPEEFGTMVKGPEISPGIVSNSGLAVRRESEPT